MNKSLLGTLLVVSHVLFYLFISFVGGDWWMFDFSDFPPTAMVQRAMLVVVEVAMILICLGMSQHSEESEK